MIGRLAGLLLQKNPPLILLEVHGVGYEVDVPMSTFYDLPALGQPVTLFTHLVVREDAHLLFGFLTESERALFRQLLKISGVGPRLALSVLSGLSVADLTDAVTRQDSARLIRIPGVGKKTAERLLLELKEKLAPLTGAAVPVGAPLSSTNEISHALAALGYNDREAVWAIKQLPADLLLEEGIRRALKLLSRME
ncbi:MAG: Holliday junction branch migration protein RuvA [Betaproteobacteria bacterium]|nr:Holliday junction branch migration protein RuvA [Betaproteobacteria bacterium]